LKQAAPNINKSLPNGWQTHPQTPKCANPRREKEKGRQGKKRMTERAQKKGDIAYQEKSQPKEQKKNNQN